MKIEVYRQYTIWQNTKTIEHFNYISGHKWATQEPLRSYYAAGQDTRVLDSFKTIRACKTHIDWLISIRNKISLTCNKS